MFYQMMMCPCALVPCRHVAWLAGVHCMLASDLCLAHPISSLCVGLSSTSMPAAAVRVRVPCRVAAVRPTHLSPWCRLLLGPWHGTCFSGAPAVPCVGACRDACLLRVSRCSHQPPRELACATCLTSHPASLRIALAAEPASSAFLVAARCMSPPRLPCHLAACLRLPSVRAYHCIL